MVISDRQLTDLQLFVGRYLAVMLCQDLADQIMQIASEGLRTEDGVIQHRKQAFAFDLLLCIENDRYRIYPSGEDKPAVIVDIDIIDQSVEIAVSRILRRDHEGEITGRPRFQLYGCAGQCQAVIFGIGIKKYCAV